MLLGITKLWSIETAVDGVDASTGGSEARERAK